jgi:hypothetical protein
MITGVFKDFSKFSEDCQFKHKENILIQYFFGKEGLRHYTGWWRAVCEVMAHITAEGWAKIA